MLVGFNEALVFSGDAEWPRAQAALNETGFGDGLPLVVPTQKRIDDMLAGIREPSKSLGLVPPLLGELTVEGVAYCCVLAGCTPDELPVVVTAALASLDHDFNLLGMLTTTGSPAICLVAHGPIVAQLSMNAEVNCLGSGNRANACIGRALQLVYRIVGGAVAGVSDMATMGQPGKYTFCFAESNSALIPPLAARRGCDPGASAVTVIGVAGMLETIAHDPQDSAERVLLPVIDAMHGGRVAHDARRYWPASEQFILVPPEMAELIRSSGWDLRAVQDFILKNSPAGADGREWPLARSADDIVVISTGGAGIKMTTLVPWNGMSVSVTIPLLSLKS